MGEARRDGGRGRGAERLRLGDLHRRGAAAPFPLREARRGPGRRGDGMDPGPAARVRRRSHLGHRQRDQEMANFDISKAGLTIAALFVIVWVVALAVWRFGNIESRWAVSE